MVKLSCLAILEFYESIMIKKQLIFFIGLTLFLPVMVAAAELSPAEMAARLQATYDSTTSFTADFSQTTAMKLSRRSREGKGTLVIRKPGLMRWDYQEPDRQVLICDGEQMLMYFAGAEQMIVMSAQEYLQSDVTYAFFAGTGNVLRDFEVEGADEEFCCGAPPDLKLVPKKQHTQVDHIYIWLDKKFMISMMRIIDHYGSITDLTFTNTKLDQPVAAERFKFIPPPGTEIIRQ
jgi:outer membrane lipoprotein carrier protein